MPQVRKRLAAKRDLVQHYVYLAEHAGIETADRFLAKAEESFSDLAAMPLMGVALPTEMEVLKGIRKWQVNGFEKFLIFYQPRGDGVSIVRVLHAAQEGGDCSVLGEHTSSLGGPKRDVATTRGRVRILPIVLGRRWRALHPPGMSSSVDRAP